MSSIRFILLSALFFTWPIFVTAQEPGFPPCEQEFLCVDYDVILQRTLRFIKEENGEEAFKEYKALEACDKCPEHRDAIEELSNEIIGIFRKKNSDLEEAKERQQQILNRLEVEKNIVAHQRDQQLILIKKTEELGREASISNYIGQAKEYLEKEEFEKAYWLTDFVYYYIDSTHQEVQKMLYQLYNEKYIVDVFEAENDFDWTEEGEDGEEDVVLNAVEWSPDNQWLATGMANGQLVVFDAEGNTRLNYTFAGESRAITDVSFNKTSQILAVSNLNGIISFLELDANGNWGMLSNTIHIYSSIRAIEWSPVDDNWLAYASDDQLVYLHDFKDQSNDFTLPSQHEDWVRDIAWSPDGTRLVSSDDQGRIVIWSITQKNYLYNVKSHTDYVRTVDWHPNGHEIISGSDDYSLVYWDTLGNPIDTSFYDEWIYQARYSDSGEKIGLSLGQNSFGMIENGEESFSDISYDVMYFDWNGEEHTFAISSEGGELSLRFSVEEENNQPFSIVESKGVEQVFQSDVGYVSSVAWSPDGQLLAYGKDNALVVVSEDSIKQINLSFEMIKKISWHPGLSNSTHNTNLLATIDDSNEIKIWDVINLNLLASTQLNNELLALEWSPDGSMLACGGTNGMLEIYRWQEGVLELLREVQLHSDYLRSLAWSPNGQYIATSSDDRTAIIYDPSKDLIIETLRGHYDWVRSVCWLSNTRLATAGDDGKTIIWENKDQLGYSVLTELADTLGFHMNLAYTGNHTRGLLATNTSSGGIVFWSIDRDSIKKDSFILGLEDVSSLSWHPRNGDLSFGDFGHLPSSINFYQDYEQKLAFDVNSKEYISRDVEDIEIRSELSFNPFFDYTLRIDPNQINQVQWSSNEQLLAHVHVPDQLGEASATIYEVATKRQLYQIKSAGEVVEAKFSPNNALLVSINSNGLITIRDAYAGTNIDTLAEQSERLLDIVWSTDSRYLVFLDETDHLSIWDHQLKTIKAKISCPSGGFQLLFNPNDSENVFLLNKEQILLLEIDRLSNGFKTLFTASTIAENVHMQWADQNKRLLLRQTQKQMLSFVYNDNRLSQSSKLAFSGDLFTPLSAKGSLICNYKLLDQVRDYFQRDERQVVTIRDMRSLFSKSNIGNTNNRSIIDMKLSHDDQLLATLGHELISDGGKYYKYDQLIEIWDIAKRQLKYELRVEDVAAIEFSPQEKYLVAVKHSGKVVFLPLEESTIHSFLLQEDKDEYFRILDNELKENTALQNFIEFCGLKKGISFDLEANLNKIAKRESYAVRKAWSQYLMDQAWLESGANAVEAFDVAALLHRNNDPNTLDSIALADIYYEQSLYYLSTGQQAKMKAKLDQSNRFSFQEVRVDNVEILLDWHQGRRQEAFDAVLDYQSQNDSRLIEQLITDHLFWQRKGVELEDELTFFRLLSVDQNIERYTNLNIDILESPTMSELLETFDDESVIPYLTRYYSVNQNHDHIAYSDYKKYLFLDQAVLFLETNYDEANFKEQIIKDYTSYLYEMMRIDAERQEMANALELSQKALAAGRLWMQREPDNEEAKNYYQFILAESAVFELITGSDAGKVKGKLQAVWKKMKDEESASPMIPLRIGHCELVLGNNPAAYEWYNSLMNDPELTSTIDDGQNMIDFTLAELNYLLPESEDELREVESDLVNLNELNFYLKAAKAVSEIRLLTSSDEGLTNIAREKKVGVDQKLAVARTLFQKDVLEESTYEFVQTKAAIANGQYAYNLLLLSLENGNDVAQKDTIQFLLEEAITLDRTADWIKSVSVLHEMINDNWHGASKRLNSIRNIMSDFPSENSSTQKAFLLYPPILIQENSNYKKHEKKLNEFLEN